MAVTFEAFGQVVDGLGGELFLKILEQDVLLVRVVEQRGCFRNGPLKQIGKEQLRIGIVGQFLFGFEGK